MRSSLVTAELFLVRSLGYQLDVTLPFAHSLNILRGMAEIPYFQTKDKRQQNQKMSHVWRRMEQEMSAELSHIARLSWTWCWDSLCSPKIALTYSSAEIAVASLYLATKMVNIDVPMELTEWVNMWGAADDMSVQVVRDVILDMLDMREQSYTASTSFSTTSSNPP
ncbi:hypothetical protein BCR43DRAFT_323567 [Syncephalastrum racemosum]|uniref:Cyclin C-terminal domain-containing protein n=1 Tax=Syncephalastrum racemosum TaxID=13706 RepID=A0A1X2H7I9_SYNRA|nr:hypothetical protein BCR43DRAFT_323567 [Syncephalastrum racemosum]